MPAHDPIRSRLATLVRRAPNRLLEAVASSYAPPRGSRVLIAVSGGADSTALMHLLAALGGGRGWNLEVASVDHGLRAGSRDDCAAVAVQAEALGLTFHGARCPAPKGASEQRMRDDRYAALHEIRTRIGADTIALGHTLDDQAETVLFRLARGTSTSGLASMKRFADPLWRPLLNVRRETLREFLNCSGIAWREDETNVDPRFRRNRVRHRLIPSLETELGPGVSRALARLARLSDEDESLLRSMADEKLQQILLDSSQDRVTLDRRALARLPAPLARRVVVACWKRIERRHGRLSNAHVEAVIGLARAEGSGRSVDLPHGLQARRCQGELSILRP